MIELVQPVSHGLVADNPEVVGGPGDHQVEEHAIFTVISVLTGAGVGYQNG